ncbi:polyprenyl synthetase family protein [Candidatus Woesearchaeota archaeon]|nr:polyprenyl synthetase family protein [Candidatus Woesearchaeota archaeon]
MGFSEILKDNRKKVDSEIKRFLPEKLDEKWLVKHIGAACYDIKAVNEFFSRPVWDFLERGGKRWRPLLMFLACGAVGGNPKAIVKFAVIPELIHNGSLVADDIEDSSLTRRNKPSIHVTYGMDVAVNLSSCMYYLPMLIIKDSRLGAERKVRIYELINEEMTRLHFGQGTDIYWHKAKNEKVSESHYFSMCAYKTGTLARLSAKLGAILGKGAEKQISALGKFAEAIGVAFQIQDDVLNLIGGVGKDFGEDITEGKMSLPVIRTLSAASKRDKKLLLGILKKHSKDKQEITMASKIINHYQSLEYSGNVADKIVRKAWSDLEPLLAPSVSKDGLKQLARFVLERKH